MSVKHTTINVTTTEAGPNYSDEYNPSVQTGNRTLSFLSDEYEYRGNVELDETMKEVIKLISDAVGEEAVLKFIIEMYEDAALNRLGYYDEEKVLKINEGLQLKPEFKLLRNSGYTVDNIGNLDGISEWQLGYLIRGEGRLLQVVNHTKLFNKVGGDVLKKFRKVGRKAKAEAQKKVEAKKARAAKKKQREIEKAKKLLEKEGVK